MRLGNQECGPIVLDGVVRGINLGFDFCAEHEWGVERAPRYLGRQGKPSRELYGAACRTTTRQHEDFPIELCEVNGSLWLRGAERCTWREEISLADEIARGGETMAMQDLVRMADRRPVGAAWDGRHGFCVYGKTEEAKAAIRVAHKALLNNRCYIIQSGGVFGAGGLKLIDADLIPSEAAADLAKADISTLRLEELVAATGIRERLQTARKTYYALSPKWTDEKAGTYRFWLNPADQHLNNYGWFSLADLEAWIDGKGPIPKTAKQRKAAS